MDILYISQRTITSIGFTPKIILKIELYMNLGAKL